VIIKDKLQVYTLSFVFLPLCSIRMFIYILYVHAVFVSPLINTFLSPTCEKNVEIRGDATTSNIVYNCVSLLSLFLHLMQMVVS